MSGLTGICSHKLKWSGCFTCSLKMFQQWRSTECGILLWELFKVFISMTVRILWSKQGWRVTARQQARHQNTCHVYIFRHLKSLLNTFVCHLTDLVCTPVCTIVTYLFSLASLDIWLYPLVCESDYMLNCCEWQRTLRPRWQAGDSKPANDFIRPPP